MTEESKTLSTMEGDVEYAVVDCDSCETETAKQLCEPYVVGNIQETKDWSILGHIAIEFDRDCYQGWLCPACQEPDGIVGLKVTPRFTVTLDQMGTLLLVTGALFFVMLLVLI